MHISLCPGVGISVGYYRRPKIVSESETGFCFLYSCPHHGHNSPLPNRLPRSQFLSDLDLVSCKIYLAPLTNALGTCGLPSLRRLSLKIDYTTNNTLIPPFLPPPDQIPPPRSQFLSDLDLVSCKIYLPPLMNVLGTFESLQHLGGARRNQVQGGVDVRGQRVTDVFVVAVRNRRPPPSRGRDRDAVPPEVPRRRRRSPVLRPG